MRTAETSKQPARYSRTERDGLAPYWPMPVDAFLGGQHLERADVMLARRRGSVFSWLIRWATQSHFSHAALVFLVPHYEKEYDKTFIIEAGPRGVDLTDLGDYLQDSSAVVAIKRHRTAASAGREPRAGRAADGLWFDETVQRRVRGRMLNTIKSKYNFAKAFAIALESLDRMMFGISERMRGRQKALKLRVRRGRSAPNEFICSGLVQLGYVEAVAELIKEGVLPAGALKQVVFDRELAALLPDDYSAFTPNEINEMMELFVDGWQAELEAARPVDLARSDQLAWQFVIIDGWVHRVTTFEEAYDLLEWETAHH